MTVIFSLPWPFRNLTADVARLLAQLANLPRPPPPPPPPRPRPPRPPPRRHSGAILTAEPSPGPPAVLRRPLGSHATNRPHAATNGTGDEAIYRSQHRGAYRRPL